MKGFVDEVVILCGGIEIARHERSYGTGVFVSEPLHDLALIETKPNALDQAAALQGWGTARPRIAFSLDSLRFPRNVHGMCLDWQVGQPAGGPVRNGGIGQ